MLGALRLLSRLELVAESLRQALDAVGVVAPEWLRGHAPPEWLERYGRRVEDYRLSRGKEAREEYAAMVAADGMRLLAAIDAPTAPAELRDLPATRTMRSIWLQQLAVIGNHLRLRDPEELPSASVQICLPTEPEARYSTKRDGDWVEYTDEIPCQVSGVRVRVAMTGLA